MVGLRGKHEDACPWELLLYRSGSLYAIHYWHTDIHQHHIGTQTATQLDGFPTVGRFPNHLQVGWRVKYLY